MSPREQALESLLELRQRVPFTAAFLTFRVEDSARDTAFLAHRMSRAHIEHGLDYFIPSSPDFQLVQKRPDDILDWNDVPLFRETATAKEILLSAGYTQGMSLVLRDGVHVIGSLHLNVSHADSFSSDEIKAVSQAREQLNSIVRGVINGVKANLTAREVEVLSHLATGQSNREIADELAITRRTVSTHVEHILTKLGVANRVQAVVMGTALGLISADFR